MKTIKVLTVIGLLGLITTFSSSFTWSQVADEDDWTAIKSSGEVEVFVKITQCEGTPYYLFRVFNNSKEVKTIELEIDIVNEPAYGPIVFMEELAPSESSEESCLSEIKLPKMAGDIDSFQNSIQITIK